MYEALNRAAAIIQTARRYFPKSVKERDRFDLELCCATVAKAIRAAEGCDQ